MIQRRVAESASAPASVHTLEAIYSPLTVDHIAHPRNLGVLEDPTGVGIVDDAETENYIVFYIQLEQNEVTAARFRALACSACIAASSLLTELVLGRTADLALEIDASQLLAALGGLPPDKQHCATLAARAAHEALLHARDTLPR